MSALELGFIDDDTIHRLLPRRKIRSDVWNRLPGASASKPIPLIYGPGQRVPGILVDAVEGKYLFGESPADTPTVIRALEVVVQDRDTQRDKLVSVFSPASPTVISTLLTDAKFEHVGGPANFPVPVNTVSFGSTAVGDNRLILAFVGIDDESASLASVTAGVVPMTLIDSQNGPAGTSNLRLEVWALLNPVKGHQDIIATLPAGVTRNMSLVTMAFSNVDQDAPFGTVAKQSVTSASPSLNVTATSGGLVADACFTASADVTADGTDQTRRALGQCDNKDRATDHRMSVTTKPGSAGTVVMSHTIASSNELVQIGVPIRGLSSATTTWATLTERGQTFRVDKGGFGDTIKLRLRPKPSEPAAAGKVTMRLEIAADGRPTGDMTEPVASVEIDAASVSGDLVIPFAFAVPPIIVTDQVAITVRYAKAAGAGDIEIALNGSGGYDNGAACERGTSRDEWVLTENARDVIAATGLTGDGMLSLDPYFGKNVFDYFDKGGKKILQVGRVSDGPGDLDEARAFVRFPLAGISTADYVKAVLRFYLVEVEGLGGSITGTLECDEIDDFGTLSAGSVNRYGFASGGDWDLPIRTSFGAIANEMSEEGSFIDVDVTTALTAAKNAGKTFMAFRLKRGAFSAIASPSGSYCWNLTSTEEGGSNAPRLRLIKDGGQDLQFSLDMLQFTIEDSVDDTTGNNVSLVDFSRPLGDDRQVIAFMDGMKDTGSGTYTGTASALLQNGADIVRHVASHPIALGLDSSRVSTTSLDAARLELASWIRMGGVIYEELRSEVWLARIAASAMGAHYQDAAGRISLFLGLTRSQPVRMIEPWESINLEVRAADDFGITGPWSRVDVYYDRDLAQIENPDSSSRSASAEWNSYSYVSAAESFPSDSSREAAASDREARYGERTNGSEGGPGDGNTFYFVPADGGTGAYGQRLRDRLFDDLGKLPDLVTAASFELPRFGANIELNDEVDVASYKFPSAAPVLRPREVRWVDTVFDGGPVEWVDDGMPVDWYSARVGRFSVREQNLDLSGGGRSPVTVLAKLLEWRTD